MTAIISLDDKDGYTLFGKRLSQDRKMVDDIISSFPKVYALPYSASIFSGKGASILPEIVDNLPDEAVVFLETEDIPKAADTLIVYRWGRHYPSDRKYSPADNGWRLMSSDDFEGYSHPKMKKEIYTR